MNTMWKEWFGSRSPRERALLLGLGFVVLCVLVYRVLLAPAIEGRAALSETLPAKARRLADMQAQAELAAVLRPRATQPVPDTQALREALRASLDAHGLRLVEVGGSGDILLLHAADVPFKQWAAWLEEAGRQHRVRAVELKARALDAPELAGHVALDATLQTPAAR